MQCKLNSICNIVEPLLSDPLLTEFVIINLKLTLPTPFKPAILVLILSDPSVIQLSCCYYPKRVG